MVLLGVSYLCFYLFFNVLIHRTALFLPQQVPPLLIRFIYTYNVLLITIYNWKIKMLG